MRHWYDTLMLDWGWFVLLELVPCAQTEGYYIVMGYDNATITHRIFSRPQAERVAQAWAYEGTYS